MTVIGDYFDLENHSTLVYTVKGDGHTYMANLRIDSLAGGGGDVWQAPFKTTCVRGRLRAAECARGRLGAGPAQLCMRSGCL